MKDTISFLHSSSAHRDEKLLELRMLGGAAYYGLWWMLLEHLREATDYKIQEKRKNAIAYAFAVPTQEFNSFFDACIELELIKISENGYFYAPSLFKTMENYDERRGKARASANKRWGKAKEQQRDSAIKCESNANAMQPHSDTNAYINTTQSNIIKSNIILDEDSWVDSVTVPLGVPENETRKALKDWVSSCKKNRKNFGQIEAEALLMNGLFLKERFPEAIRQAISNNWKNIRFDSLPNKDQTKNPNAPNSHRKLSPTELSLQAAQRISDRINAGNPLFIEDLKK